MLKAVFAALALPLLAAPAEGHHSTAMYDLDREITVEGVVTDFIYTNPHTWLILAVPGTDGTTTVWGFEGEGPGLLYARGIDEDDFSIGEEVSVTGNPMRDGRPAAHWLRVVKADGTVLDPQGPFIR